MTQIKNLKSITFFYLTEKTIDIQPDIIIKNLITKYLIETTSHFLSLLRPLYKIERKSSHIES